MNNQTNEDIKRKVLENRIHEAAHRIAEEYLECNSEDVPKEYRLSDRRISPNWLDSGYCDQVSESLYGDAQADDIEIDTELFPESELEGKYGKGNNWNLIEKYFNSEDVEEIFYEEWENVLVERFGPNWKELK